MPTTQMWGRAVVATRRMARAACIRTRSRTRFCKPQIPGGIALHILRHGRARETATHERHLHLRLGMQQADVARVVTGSFEVHETIAENKRRLLAVRWFSFLAIMP